MDALERLKRDHVILRAKLSVVEGALTMGPEMWFVLREVCHTLSCQLQDHIKREEELVRACKASLTDEALSHLTVEHKDEPALLRTVNRLFIEDEGHSLVAIKPALTRLIDGLHAHMDEEEAELFPVLEQVLALREASPVREPQATSHVTETMAVNRVLREFPATKQVFDSLFVNVPFEGCDCLDEVAWRRGMETRDLIDKLEEMIASCRCPQAGTAERAESKPGSEEATACHEIEMSNPQGGLRCERGV